MHDEAPVQAEVPVHDEAPAQADAPVQAEAKPPPTAADAAYAEELIAAGLTGRGDRLAAKGVAFGVILSVPVWVILLYFIFR